MPRYLSAASLVVAVYAGAASDDLRTGLVPAVVVAACVAAQYALWQVRGRPWHDWTIIGILLPAIGAGVWIAVGGLVLGVEREDDARLLVEVGPGVALTGLLCTLVSYHGRHDPRA